MEKLVDAVLLRRRSLFYFLLPSGAERRQFVGVFRSYDILGMGQKIARLELGDGGDLVRGLPIRDGQIRDMLIQQTFFDYFNRLIVGLPRPWLLKSLMWMIGDTLTASRQLLQQAEDQRLAILAVFTAWSRITDMIFNLLYHKILDYAEFAEELVASVSGQNTAASSSRIALEPDTLLPWLLVQFQAQLGAVADEERFAKLLQLVPERPPPQSRGHPTHQILDYSFLCLVTLQGELRDKFSRKFPHPWVWAQQPDFDRSREQIEALLRTSSVALPYSPDQYFALALCSQVKPGLVLTVIQGGLFPTGENRTMVPLPNGSGFYVQAPPLPAELIELLHLTCKKNLATTMVEKLPAVVSQQPGAAQVLPVHSPAVLEAAARVFASLRLTMEMTMVRAFLKKLKSLFHPLSDRSLPLAQETNFLRLCQLIMEFCNHRLLRLLKYSNIYTQLFLIIPDTVTTQRRWQLYQSTEFFVMTIAANLTDLNLPKFLRQGQPADDLYSFGNSELLKRAVVQAVARVVRLRGSWEVASEALTQILQHLYDKRPHFFAPACLKFFPPVMESFYRDKVPPRRLVPDIPLLLQSTLHNCLWVTAQEGQQEQLLQFYADPEHQPTFLCVLWHSALRMKKIQGDFACGFLGFSPLLPSLSDGPLPSSDAQDLLAIFRRDEVAGSLDLCRLCDRLDG